MRNLDETDQSRNVNGNFNNNVDILNSADVELFSPDAAVLDIMQRYRGVDITASDIELTHFKISLTFENVTRPFLVPNPLVLTRRDCAVWPYEIKQALGLTGTMQVVYLLLL